MLMHLFSKILICLRLPEPGIYNYRLSCIHENLKLKSAPDQDYGNLTGA